MTQSRDPTPAKLTPSPEIRKPVAGRALPGPVIWVWGVCDPHPFSRFIFDPPTLPHLGSESTLLTPPVPPSTLALTVCAGAGTRFHPTNRTQGQQRLHRRLLSSFFNPSMGLQRILDIPPGIPVGTAHSFQYTLVTGVSSNIQLVVALHRI